MILYKTWLERAYNFSIVYPFSGVVSSVLVELMFFRICFVRTFSVTGDYGICFIRSTVRLGHVEKWNFLIYWRRVFTTGLNSVAWYHCTISGLILATGALSAPGCGWLGGWSELLVRLTCHMLDVFEWVHSNIVITPLTKLR